MKFLGKHFIVDFYDCSKDILSHVDKIEEIMLASAKVGNVNVIYHKFKQFDPFGVSGALIIAESHITIHTWPEKRYASVDIFVCSNESKPENIVEFLKNNLQSQYFTLNILERGYTSK